MNTWPASDENERQSNQELDISAAKHVKERSPLFGWTTTNRPLDIKSANLSSAQSTGTSINTFVR